MWGRDGNGIKSWEGFGVRVSGGRYVKGREEGVAVGLQVVVGSGSCGRFVKE